MEQGHSLNISYKTAEALITLQHRDKETQLHCERVANIAVQAGVLIGLDDELLYQLETAALFHDIGELGVPNEILLNQKNLSDSQRELMNSHTLIGANIAEKLDIPDPHKVAEIIRHHHEYYDGSGYPYGLKGERIPLASRIIGIIDSFDTLTSHHSSHNLISTEKTLSMMAEKMIHLFDPHVFDIVAKVLKDAASSIVKSEIIE